MELTFICPIIILLVFVPNGVNIYMSNYNSTKLWTGHLIPPTGVETYNFARVSEDRGVET